MDQTIYNKERPLSPFVLAREWRVDLTETHYYSLSVFQFRTSSSIERRRLVHELRLKLIARLAAELTPWQKWRQTTASKIYRSYCSSEPFAQDVYWLRSIYEDVPDAEKQGLQEVFLYEYIQGKSSNVINSIVETTLTLSIFLSFFLGWRLGIIQEFLGFAYVR